MTEVSERLKNVFQNCKARTVQSMGPGTEATFPYQAGRGMQQFMQLSDYILTNASA